MHFYVLKRYFCVSSNDQKFFENSRIKTCCAKTLTSNGTKSIQNNLEHIFKWYFTPINWWRLNLAGFKNDSLKSQIDWWTWPRPRRSLVEIKREKTRNNIWTKYISAFMLRRGLDSHGNIRHTTLQQVEISDRLTPTLSRPKNSLHPWQKDLLDFNLRSKDLLRRYKTACFLCGRTSKDGDLFEIQ